MNKIKFKLLVLIILFSNINIAQNILISQGGTVNVSGGEVFYDSGGAAGNYSNTNYTITLCPANAGEKVVVDFSYFKTQFSSFEQDALFIYDGNSATGNDIGKLMGDYSIRTGNSSTPYGVGRGNTNSADANNIFRPTIFAATNASGCLTFKFVKGSSASTSFAGWIGAISTYKDLGAPGCTITLTGESICSGGSTTLTATGDLITSSLNNNFNGSVGTGWVGSPAATIVSNVCSAPSLDGSQYLWMQNYAFPRSLESLAMDVSNGGTISFEYRQAKYNSDPSPCESPDILSSGTTNEGVFVQYSIDNGANWSTLKYLFSNSLNSNSGTADTYNNGCGDYVTRWTKMTYPIPNIARTTSTKFRWIQPAGTSASTDNWGLDNVIVSSQKNKTITITNLTAGGSVVGTSTTSPYSISVSPTSTTTYRATITDGVTSCYDDVTINVNSTPATTIAYPSSTVTNSETTTQTITITNGPVSGNYTATPAGLSINPTTGAVTPNTSTPGSYTISVPTACGTATTTLVITATPCGTCAAPTCPVGFNPNINTNSFTVCNFINTDQTYAYNQTVTNYYTVTSSPSGTLGFVQELWLDGACSSTPDGSNTFSGRTYSLYALGDCNGTAIIATTSNAGHSATLNPEWTGLTPNTNYILKVSVPITTCGISKTCTDYYFPVATCSTCSTATCSVTSITTTTAALGQTGITTALNSAGDQLGLNPITQGQSITVCVPVTVPVGSTILGFKQISNNPLISGVQSCSATISYQLKNSSCGTTIAPNVTNASGVASGFNPEWNGLTAGNYVLCFTVSVSGANCIGSGAFDLLALGYYNVIPTIACQDYQIQMYDDDALSTTHNTTTFACSDSGVYLGPVSLPSVFDGGLPFPALKITITATTGTLNNLVLNRYDAGTNAIAEVLTVPSSGISNNYFLRPAPGQYYKLDKTNTASGTYNYTIVDVISGATVASGIWTIVSGAESAASAALIPQGSGSYSGPGVTNGFDPTGVDNYTNDRGIGYFNPSLAGPGTHTITYTWNNGLAAPNNCTLTRTKIVTVTGPSAPTVSNISICSGTTAILTAGGITSGAVIKWYDVATGGTPLFTGNPFTTPVLTSNISYWVSQTIGSCESNRTKIDVTVNPNVSPTFTQVSDICSGATLSALPTSSTNGITGSWSPALNNTATTTYTFTPDTGQCATTATMTITVNPNVTPTFTQVSDICSGATLSALPTSSTNGITGSWSPALNNTATTTYTFTPDAGQCATTATMTITVNPNVTPTFTQVSDICSGATLSALPTSSTNGITGSWSPALNNTATTTYTFTPTAGQCATTATMTITVNPNVSPTFTQVVAICSGATLSALPTSSTNGITGSWSPALNNTATTTYTFTPDTGQCATTATMTITVNPNVSPTFTQVSAICSGATLSALPTSSTNGITGSWSPALNNTATTTYTFTPTAGQCATTATMTITVNPNVSPTFTQVVAICSGATLSALPTSSTNGITGSWSPALNNTATTTYTFTPTAGQCATTATMTINVTNGILPLFTQVSPVCEGATINIPTSSLNTPPIVGVWNLISSTANDVTYEFTPNPGQCGLTTTMTIVVHPLPTVIPSVTTQSFCSGGTTNINLVSNVPGSVFYWTATGTSITGQSGSVIGSGATSINQTLVLDANIVNAGQVTYSIVAEANGCLGAPVTVVVTVNPIPNVIVSPASLTQTICSGETTTISFSGAINNTVYTWSVVSSTGVSGALNGSGTAINQTLTTTGLSQGTVVYEVTPSLNGCTGIPQRITVTVNPVPVAIGPAAHRDLCSGESTDISVSTFNAATVFNWTVEPHGVSGASAGTDSGLSITIAQTLTTIGNTRGYVDYIITPVLTGCLGIPITVRVYVNPLPVVSLTDGTICVDAAGVPFQSYELDSGLNDVDYDFVWTFNGNSIAGANNATYTATEVGTYTVVATNHTTNCVSNIASAVVTATNPATSLTVTQSEYFSDNAILTVNVSGGNGSLLYQLDQGILQESNVFTGVSGGTHIITVVDTQGCTYLTQEVLVIDYPKYFTPNGDGHNDTWNITGLNQPDAKLYIFDRYGKLLKQLSTTTASEGWNGIYNNEKLPSTDYWFTLDYTENGTQKQFKAHFSLVR